MNNTKHNPTHTTTKGATKGAFRMQCRSFFLTYPAKHYKALIENMQEYEAIDLLIKAIKEKIETLKARWIHILACFETGEEEHDSKNYEHFHVFIKFDRKVEVSDCNYWDLEGVHGHYTSCGKSIQDQRRVCNYIKKDRVFREFIDRRITEDLHNKPMKVDNLSKIISHLVSKIEQKGYGNDRRALSTVLRQAVKEMDLGVRSLYHLNENKAKKAIFELINHNSGVIMNQNIHTGNVYNVSKPAEMLEWEECMHSKSLVILGRSNTGKTTLAKQAFKNPLIVSDVEDLKKLTEEHDGLIFDDFSMKGMTKEGAIHIFDVSEDRTILVKFSSVTIPKGMPRIFTHNAESFKEFLQSFFNYANIIGNPPKQYTRRVICIIVDQDQRILDKDHPEYQDLTDPK